MSLLFLVPFLRAITKLHTLPVVQCALHLQRKSTKSLPLPHSNQGTQTSCKVGIRLVGVGGEWAPWVVFRWHRRHRCGLSPASCWGTLLLFIPISYSYTLNGKSLKGRHPPLFPHHLTHWYIVGSHYKIFLDLWMIAKVHLKCITFCYLMKDLIILKHLSWLDLYPI